MTIFYFTSTGNCLAVAKKMGGELVSIPQVVGGGTQEYQDDVIGVIFPIYGFGTPKMVRRFITNARFAADYTFAIGTYGNLPGAAMENVAKLAQRRGKSGDIGGFDYAKSLLMFDNYLPMFEVGKETERTKEKNIEENLDKILADIAARRHFVEKAAIGWKIATSLMRAGERFVINGRQAQGYIVDEKCIKCGVCAKVCPSGNIVVDDEVRFADRCEGCLGCVHLCPQNAIHLKNEKSSSRFRNAAVSLDGIIAANNQKEAENE
ncbi:MAG: EFR1 family ferrodoxin [Clostridiales bacterium]|jgi:Pyruvate/2-oxoacid:ferredoxin oxidoreductase delta subunit|nr:EFR1 family ferrodoxin [Clostridiales bacterium]